MKPIFIGGLMRCCYETINEYRNGGGRNDTGTVVRCKYVPDDPLHQVIARDDGWHWNRPPETPDTPSWRKT